MNYIEYMTVLWGFFVIFIFAVFPLCRTVQKAVRKQNRKEVGGRDQKGQRARTRTLLPEAQPRYVLELPL